jgi:site-specific DNA recombinase
VSTEEQAREDRHSLDYQEQLGRDQVKQKGWRLVKVRKDVGSGKAADNRPGYQELLDDVRQAKVDVAIVYKLDRLSRNVRDVYAFLDLIKQHSVEFVSLSEGFDTTTPMGRAALGVSAVFSQLTRETIGENVTNGLRQRAREGKAHGGCLPYGYARVNGGLVVNPVEAEAIRMMFRCYVDEKLSIGGATQRVNAAGHRTRGGQQWKSSHVSRVLRNPVYKGMVRLSGITAQGKHEPIIPTEVFDAAQGRLEPNGHVLHPRTRAARLLLLGIARCGYCGKPIRGRYTSGSYYYCLGNQSVGEEYCPSVMKRTTYVDDLVIKRLAAVADNEDVQRLALQEAEGIMAEELAPLGHEREKLQTELGKLADTFTRWADRLDQGLIDEHQFAQRNQELLDRKRVIVARTAELDQTLARREKVGVELDNLKAALADFPRLWEQGTLDEHKELVRLLVEKLEITREEVRIKVKFMPEEVVPLPNMRGRRKATKVRSGGVVRSCP